VADLDRRELARILDARDLAFLAVGCVIGSGIFLVPAPVLRACGGSVGLALFVWAAAGVLCLLGGLTYGELCTRRPAAGGLYVFVREAFGRLPAFLYGWTLFLVIGPGAVATLSVGFSAYLHEFVPLSPALGKVASVAMIAVLAVVNVRGTRASADLQNWTTAVKAGGVALISLLLIARGERLFEPSPAVPAGFDVVTGLGVALVSVLWAYEGWQFVTYSAGETLDPQRSFPRGMAVGTSVLVVLYLLANLGYVAVLGPQGVMGATRVAAEAAGVVLGAAAGKLLAGVALVAMFSAANSIILTSPRVYFAMARDGLFFRHLAEVHGSFGTPAISIVVSALWAALLAVTGTFEQLLTYVVFAGWIFYGLGAAALFSYRRREPAAPFRTPGYPWTTLVFVLAAAFIVGNTFLTQPREALVGAGIVLLGVPAYLFWRKPSIEAPP
jgi:APA family basic amino acid/polyamine antiporter